MKIAKYSNIKWEHKYKDTENDKLTETDWSCDTFLKSWRLNHSKCDGGYLEMVTLVMPVNQSVLQDRVHHRFGTFCVENN